MPGHTAQKTPRAQHGPWCECQTENHQEGGIINRNQNLVKLSCNFKMHNSLLFLSILFKCECEADLPEYHDCESWPSQSHEEKFIRQWEDTRRDGSHGNTSQCNQLLTLKNNHFLIAWKSIPRQSNCTVLSHCVLHKRETNFRWRKQFS